MRQFSVVYGLGIGAMALFLAAVAALSAFSGKPHIAWTSAPVTLASAAIAPPLATGLALAQAGAFGGAAEPG